MGQPTCDYCGKDIESESNFVSLSGGTVHRSEPQADAGGGLFHPVCGREYIQKNYEN